MRFSNSAMPAVVIGMPVRGDQAVDLREAGVLGGGDDALGVADRAVEVAGVDQERFTGRVHEQRRVAAFDVDDIDVQRRAGACAPAETAVKQTKAVPSNRAVRCIRSSRW